jgi:hypothetical protein
MSTHRRNPHPDPAKVTFLPADTVFAISTSWHEATAGTWPKTPAYRSYPTSESLVLTLDGLTPLQADPSQHIRLIFSKANYGDPV